MKMFPTMMFRVTAWRDLVIIEGGRPSARQPAHSARPRLRDIGNRCFYRLFSPTLVFRLFSPTPIFKVRSHLVDPHRIPWPVCHAPSRSTGVSNSLQVVCVYGCVLVFGRQPCGPVSEEDRHQDCAAQQKESHQQPCPDVTPAGVAGQRTFSGFVVIRTPIAHRGPPRARFGQSP
jgi:hypothetical protein